MRARSLPTAALLLILPSCCPLARFFCGPDKTDWVSIDFTTPEATVKTMLEALRRDEPAVLYRCLARDYTRRLGVDDYTMQLAWPKIVEANPGLHVAGYAEVPPARRVTSERAEVVLDIEGHQVQVQLQRLGQWRVRYERPLQPSAEPGGAPWLPPPGEASLPIGPFAAVVMVRPNETDAEASTIAIATTRIEHAGVDELTPDQIEFFGVERLWKVTDVRAMQ